MVNRIPEVKKKQMQKKLLNNIDKEDNPYAEDIEVAIEDEQVPMQRTAVKRASSTMALWTSKLNWECKRATQWHSNVRKIHSRLMLNEVLP